MRRSAAGGPYHLQHALSFKCPSIRSRSARRGAANVEVLAVKAVAFRGHAGDRLFELPDTVRLPADVFCFSRRLMKSQGVFCSRVLSTAPVIRAMWGRQACNRRTQAPLREVFLLLKTIFYHLGFIEVRRYFDTVVLDFRLRQNGHRRRRDRNRAPSGFFLENSLCWQAIACPLLFITLDNPVFGALRKEWVNKCTFTPPATVRATVWP